MAAAEVHRGARAHIRNIYEKGGTAVLFGNLLKDLPAWLISLVVHLVAILLLGLWYDEPSEDSPSITLATSISYEDLEGGRDMAEQTPEAFEFEDPGAIEMPGNVEVAGAPSRHVDLEPMEVPIDVPDPVGRLPSALTRSTTPLPPAPMGRMFAGRDPQARARAVERSGGTSFTEAAGARGLKFLARHQNPDGSWSLEKFHRSPDCDRTCDGAGQMRNDAAATALALLPFLGAGQTHEEGEYATEVFKGLNWLLRHQEEDGDLRGEGPRISQMYAHAQAAIVLCEAYAMTGDEQLREAAQMALNFIMHAQNTQGDWPGGWRYEPGEWGDTSVLGWQLMALKSGQMSYLQVLPRTFEMAGYYLDRAQTDRIGERYGYQPGHPPTEAMTAEALLCRQYLGWPKDRPGLKSGVQYLLREHPPNRKQPNIYYWYYATQVMRHFGGEPWERWNAKMSETLVAMQEKRGHAAGSWTPRGQGNSSGHAETGGRIYMTSLAVCILEVYYRHMPLYGEDVLEGAQ
ncbi:MAG: hypothetical protein A2V70_11755 [Planctomycetes bacterium RBG_13_63_9]|nr:MAG: hypothetical protein A2V70_11755 [Planctomycetes bacterium RBG_13_63_9]